MYYKYDFIDFYDVSDTTIITGLCLALLKLMNA